MKELLYLKDDQLIEFIEKISMSYRETFSDAKKVLDRNSIGIAHHKVINLISLYLSKISMLVCEFFKTSKMKLCT